MPKAILIVAIFAITAILIGSLSVDPNVFADKDKKHHHKKDKHGHEMVPDSRLYVNSLTLDPHTEDINYNPDPECPDGYIPNADDSSCVMDPIGAGDDRCIITDSVIQNSPCFIVDPFQDGSVQPIFIADPALHTTQTIIQVNVHEKNNFPTLLDDIIEFPDCGFTIPTPANFYGMNGILIECDIDSEKGLIDLVYSFMGPNQNFTENDDAISECDCTKPKLFTVEYTGTEIVKVEIWKTGKDKMTPKDKLTDALGPYSPGEDIPIDSMLWGKDKLESNTTYVFYTLSLDEFDNETLTQIGTVNIHTSCSKDLFIDQVWDSDNSDISLKVVSGSTPDIPQSIPPMSCLDT